MALAVIFGIVAAGTALGFYGGRRPQLNLEEWAVAGRGLGLLLVWILLAGETFTTFSVLGISGWVYAKGGPTLYVLAYLALAYVFIFLFGPPIWEAGRRRGLQTLGDFFQDRYGSRMLSSLVAAAGTVFLVVYLQLQLQGLGIIVEAVSSGDVGRTPAMVAAAVVIACFVSVSGVRGAVWTSVLKDVLLVGVALAVGIGIPWRHFGGIGPMFHALSEAKPGFLTMPGGTRNLGHTWFASTVLVNSLLIGWPHFFASIFTAKSADTVRRNAVIMPLYLLPLALIIFAGCAAVLVVPGLANGDLALLEAARRTFPPWLLGVIGGAGALTAIVPASIHILTASTLVVKNLAAPLMKARMGDAQAALAARLSAVAATGLSLLLALHSSATLVGLLLMAYSGVAQFGPGILLGVAWRRARARGVLAGLVAGLAIAAFLSFTHRDPFLGLNAGFIGLLANVALVVGITWAAPPKEGSESAALGYGP